MCVGILGIIEGGMALDGWVELEIIFFFERKSFVLMIGFHWCFKGYILYLHEL